MRASMRVRGLGLCMRGPGTTALVRTIRVRCAHVRERARAAWRRLPARRRLRRHGMVCPWDLVCGRALLCPWLSMKSVHMQDLVFSGA